MKVAVDCRCRTGENPLWHPEEERVYWLDIPAGRVFRYDPVRDEDELFFFGRVTGGFTLQENGNLLLFMDRGTIAEWDGTSLNPIVEEIPEERESRFNDVIAAPDGRVFCGTMPGPQGNGRLYRLDRDGSLTVMLEDIECSNGMGFTPDLEGMYYTDSGRGQIYLFDYNQDEGTLTNQRTFLKVPGEEGVPDGMTVDSEGCVWSARWGGGALFRYSPSGEEVRRIEFPAQKVSSVTFGGKELEELYVTTAGGDNRPEEGQYAGALFRLPAGVQGRAEFNSRIGN